MSGIRVALFHPFLMSSRATLGQPKFPRVWFPSHDERSAREYVLTSCIHPLSLRAIFLSPSFFLSLPFQALIHGQALRHRLAAYPLTFPLTLLFFPFFIFLKLSSEIRAVSNFDHANIRWLRRVTPLGSRRRSINAHERVRYIENMLLLWIN